MNFYNQLHSLFWRDRVENAVVIAPMVFPVWETICGEHSLGEWFDSVFVLSDVRLWIRRLLFSLWNRIFRLSRLEDDKFVILHVFLRQDHPPVWCQINRINRINRINKVHRINRINRTNRIHLNSSVPIRAPYPRPHQVTQTSFRRNSTKQKGPKQLLRRESGVQKATWNN